MKLSELRLTFLLSLVSSLIILGVSAAIYHEISANMTIETAISPVVFTDGEDTTICGGSLSSTRVTFTSIPLGVESSIVITQLVNITNKGSSDHSVQFYFSAEDFRGELSSLRLYLVRPSGLGTLVLELNDSGDVVRENVSVNIPQGEEWSIKLEGHYDSGTSTSKRNTMILNLQVT